MTHRTPHPDPHTTDPVLDALLDEALAPEAAPAGLGDRVLTATAAQVAARRSPVAGRIGGWKLPALRIAAAVLIAAGVIGLVFVNTHPTVPVPPNDAPPLAQLNTLNATAYAAARQGESIDLQIEAFALQVTLADRSDPWAAPDEAFNDLAIEAQMDLLAADFEQVF